MNAPLNIKWHSPDYVQIFDSRNNWVCTCHRQDAETIKAALELSPTKYSDEGVDPDLHAGPAARKAA